MKSSNAIFLLPLFLFGCSLDDLPNFLPDEAHIDHRQEMRDFVQDLSRYAKNRDRDFLIIPQNAVELVTTSGTESGAPDTDYIRAIDGMGQESLFYGLGGIDQPTPQAERRRLRTFLDLAVDNGDVTILITDYAFSQSNIDDSYAQNAAAGYISFAADHRELDNIPDYPSPIHNVNSGLIERLPEIRNFLYLINPRLYSTRQALVDAISDTNYDLVIMDFFFNGQEFTDEQIVQLRKKANGGERLLIAYMSIGRAEDFRFYWQSHWPGNPPVWLGERDSGLAGGYFVNYWNPAWQDIIYGGRDDYLDRIIDAGFDGVYLDFVDAFEHFEDLE